MRIARFLVAAAISAGTCFGGAIGVRAASLEDVSLETLIANTVENHDRVLASRAQVEAAYQRSEEALGAWYPSLDVSANVERLRVERTEQNTVITPAQNATATITQLLWDFGVVNAAVERARLEHVQAEIGLVQTRQGLTAEALAAYINLLSSVDVVTFARRSVDNIRRQTGLEEARIEAGSGLSTDLLQAKTQLAGAQARLVDAEGAFELALNRFRAVYGDVPEDMDALAGLDVDQATIPTELDDALDAAFKGNPALRLTSIDISLANQDRIATERESYAPRFDIVGERSMTKNEGGTIGRKVESSIKLELNFPFNLGFTSINTLRAAQSDVVSASRTMADLERTIEEQVRNAWKQLETAQLRKGHLFDQAGIARAFLEVAIEERRLGQRSLIDVLAGETSLINAQSDAISAEADVQLAIVDLLLASGALDFSVINTVARPDRSEMLAPIAGLSDIQVAPDPVMDLLRPSGSLGDEIDPSQLLNSSNSGDVFSPPPNGGTIDPTAPELQLPDTPGNATSDIPLDETPLDETPAAPAQPTIEPAPETGVSVDPEQPISETSEEATDQERDSLLNSLSAPPGFDTAPPVPEVLESLPRPQPPQSPPADLPQSELMVPADPAVETSPPSTPPETPASEGEDGSLDNPLFDWAQ